MTLKIVYKIDKMVNHIVKMFFHQSKLKKEVSTDLVN